MVEKVLAHAPPKGKQGTGTPDKPSAKSIVGAARTGDVRHFRSANIKKQGAADYQKYFIDVSICT
jgi:hypothetical protein